MLMLIFDHTREKHTAPTLPGTGTGTAVPYRTAIPIIILVYAYYASKITLVASCYVDEAYPGRLLLFFIRGTHSTCINSDLEIPGRYPKCVCTVPVVPIGPPENPALLRRCTLRRPCQHGLFVQRRMHVLCPRAISVPICVGYEQLPSGHIRPRGCACKDGLRRVSSW